MLEFILAEKGLVEMFSSIGRFTDGMGLLEMPLSYRRDFSALFFDQSGAKLFKSIYSTRQGVSQQAKNLGTALPKWQGRRQLHPSGHTGAFARAQNTKKRAI